jgi:hypothetical protein
MEAPHHAQITVAIHVNTRERRAPLIIGRPDQKGSTERDKRMFVEGVLWIVRKGSWAAQGIRGQ